MANIRNITDSNRVKKLTNKNVISAFSEKKFIGKKYTLSFKDVEVEDPKYSLFDQKKAILNKKSLTSKVTGTYVVTDNKTNKVVGKKKTTLGRLPWRTQRGTYLSKGNEYSIANQFRLKYGVYSRRKANDELEAHFNIKPGTGNSFRILLEPESGVFRLIIQQAKPYLYPFLKAAGVSDSVLQKNWGSEVLKLNRNKGSSQDVDKIYARLAGYKVQSGLSTQEKAREIIKIYNKMSMDAKVNHSTVKMPMAHVNMGLILKVTRKLLDMNRGVEEEDDRDSLEYRNLKSSEDFFAERVNKDAGKTGQKLLRRLERGRPVKDLPPGAYTKAFSGLITEDDKSATGEQLNPLEILESSLKTTPLGEGGLDARMVTKDLPNVHPSHFGFLDPVRTPESEKAGLTLYLTENTQKGDDGKLYKQVLDVKTNKLKHITSENFHKHVVAFPGEWQSSKKMLKVMSNKKMTQAPRNKIDYALVNASDMFTVSSNLVPMVQSAQGNRLLMAAKIMGQALPLKNPEEALVQTKIPGKNQTFDNKYGKQTSAALAPVSGKVSKITADFIEIKDALTGKTVRKDIYNNFPYNRKTSIHQTPVVKVGDLVSKGDVIAKSNYTNEKGTLALGKNLRTGYVSYKGHNFEDGIVISESAADKLTSQHTYSYEVEIDEGIRVGKNNFVSYFPGQYPLSDLSHISKEGVAVKGTKVKKGQPLILAMQKRTPTASDISLGNIHKSLKNTYRNISEEWNHSEEGEVIESVVSGKFLKVIVKVYQKMIVGDKLSGRHGNKGVVAKILPDKEMPRSKEGGHLEVLLNPQGVITRINPSQIHETLLGKVAAKDKKVKQVKNFHKSNSVDFVRDELKRVSLKDKDEVLDPETGKSIGKVLTGSQYFLKLSSTAEKGFQARGFGEGYTTEESPSKGLSIGPMELNALVAHNARKTMRDVVTRKGQKNDEMWKALRSGQPLPPPKVPFIHKKFISSLQAAGINVEKKGDQVQALPLTDKKVEEMSSGEVKNDTTLRTQDYRPEREGLFDEAITGGIQGKNWSHIKLGNKLPNPVMENSIRILLDLTKNQLLAILSGKEKLNGKSGGQAILLALDKINIDQEIKKQRALAESGKKIARDKAIKKLRVLYGSKQTNIHPRDYIISKIPVIPPVFRPISPSASGPDIIADSNFLYKDLISANNTIKEVTKAGLDDDDEDLQQAKEYQYDSLKKLYGYSTLQTKKGEKPLKGFIQQVVGTAPKFGMFQNKVIKKRQDLSGRAVITPDPQLGIDQVGLPEEMAWKMFSPFVMKKLVQLGHTPLAANKLIEDKDRVARDALLKAMQERPVLVNRNPSLHKYNIMALKPTLNQEKVLTLPPLIEEGFNADHDGDQMNVHVPVSDDAVEEAYQKLLPSKNLYKGARKKAYWVPTQEAALGIARATTPAQDSPVAIFNSVEEAKKAYRLGKIKINDMIEIKGLK